MSSVDAAWLRMDDDAQRMMITALFRFDGELAFEELMALIRGRLLAHPRFRQRVERSRLPGVPPMWVEDHRLDLATHVRRVALPAPGDEAALSRLVSDLASTPLDARAPLWQLHLVEGAPGGTALVARIHHAVGDGVSLVKVLLSLTDESAAERPSAVGLTLPRLPRDLAARARVAVDHSTTMARLLAMAPDPPTALLGGPLGRQKNAVWSAALPLERIKRAGATAEAKVNDVLMTLVGGALRRYLGERGERSDTLELRGLVPVYFQGHATNGLGNHFGLVFAPLLVGIADARERLRAVKARMDALKAAPDAIVALEVLMVMGLAGGTAGRLGMDIFTRKASALVSSVPGPPARVHLAGRPVADLVVWAPVAGHLGLSLTMLSYAGHVRVGVLADARRVPDARPIADGVSVDLSQFDEVAVETGRVRC